MPNVYLIGAGPGDLGLLTIKGKKAIQSADAVVYDYLANPAFLKYAKPGAEIIYVGKKGGDHTLPQDKINELIIAKAKEGKVVARLKGGDPYVFGRGGEEAEELVAAGLTFEVVPGVTAGVAAAAYAGIPVTHRAFTPSVCFITGHEDPGKAQSTLHWDVYAKSTSTLVFYMGVKNLPDICAKLMEAGRPGDEPVALVYRGTSCRQRSFVSTLAEAPAEAKRLKFTAPSIIIVGGVCGLRDTLGWFEKRPLLGRGVVVTRAREQASDFASVLEDLGACVLEFPTIAVKPLPDYAEVRTVVENLRDYGWVIFTSTNGVDHFWRILKEMGKDARALGPCQVAAIGPATADALRERGIEPDFVPPKYVAESVVEGLLARGVQGKKVLIPRAKVAREVLPEELAKAGAEVRVLPVYETGLAEAGPDEFLEWLARGDVQFVTFTSSSTVENFFALVPKERIAERRADLKIACIGPVTAKTLARFGFTPDISPEDYTIPGLAAALAKAVESE